MLCIDIDAPWQRFVMKHQHVFFLVLLGGACVARESPAVSSDSETSLHSQQVLNFDSDVDEAIDSSADCRVALSGMFVDNGSGAAEEYDNSNATTQRNILLRAESTFGQSFYYGGDGPFSPRPGAAAGDACDVLRNHTYWSPDEAYDELAADGAINVRQDREAPTDQYGARMADERHGNVNSRPGTMYNMDETAQTDVEAYAISSVVPLQQMPHLHSTSRVKTKGTGDVAIVANKTLRFDEAAIRNAAFAIFGHRCVELGSHDALSVFLGIVNSLQKHSPERVVPAVRKYCQTGKIDKGLTNNILSLFESVPHSNTEYLLRSIAAAIYIASRGMVGPRVTESEVVLFLADLDSKDAVVKHDTDEGRPEEEWSLSRWSSQGSIRAMSQYVNPAFLYSTILSTVCSSMLYLAQGVQGTMAAWQKDLYVREFPMTSDWVASFASLSVQEAALRIAQRSFIVVPPQDNSRETALLSMAQQAAVRERVIGISDTKLTMLILRDLLHSDSCFLSRDPNELSSYIHNKRVHGIVQRVRQLIQLGVELGPSELRYPGDPRLNDLIQSAHIRNAVDPTFWSSRAECAKVWAIAAFYSNSNIHPSARTWTAEDIAAAYESGTGLETLVSSVAAHLAVHPMAVLHVVYSVEKQLAKHSLTLLTASADRIGVLAQGILARYGSNNATLCFVSYTFPSGVRTATDLVRLEIAMMLAKAIANDKQHLFLRLTSLPKSTVNPFEVAIARMRLAKKHYANIGGSNLAIALCALMPSEFDLPIFARWHNAPLGTLPMTHVMEALSKTVENDALQTALMDAASALADGQSHLPYVSFYRIMIVAAKAVNFSVADTPIVRRAMRLLSTAAYDSIATTGPVYAYGIEDLYTCTLPRAKAYAIEPVEHAAIGPSNTVVPAVHHELVLCIMQPTETTTPQALCMVMGGLEYGHDFVEGLLDHLNVTRQDNTTVLTFDVVLNAHIAISSHYTA